MLSYSLAWPFGERVSESAARAPLAPERLPPRLAARLVGKQPILTFVTAGELARWTKLRHWGPGNLAMPGSWLAGKPVIPGSKAIAAVWGGLSAAAIQRGRPRPVNDTWVAALLTSCRWPPSISRISRTSPGTTGCRCSSRSLQHAHAPRPACGERGRGTAAAPARLLRRGNACRGGCLPWSRPG